MAYVDYEYYKTLYGDRAVSENDFNRLLWNAQRKIDDYTTGVDGVVKLELAYPTDERSAEAVKRCVCEVISYLDRIEKAEVTLESAYTTEKSEYGQHFGMVSSVNSGSESISFSNGGTGKSLVETVLADPLAQKKMFGDLIREGLTGIRDNNGVNLLYLGMYPEV